MDTVQSQLGKPLALVVNGEIMAAPIIREVLSSGVEFSGLKQADAEEIVKLFEDR